jgi:hypothetical protein
LSVIDRRYRLATGAGRLGLDCTTSGISLAGTALLRICASGFEIRPLEEIRLLLEGAFGRDVDPADLLPGLAVAVEALNKGDQARAAIAALHLRLPELTCQGAKGLAKAEQFLAKYDSDEPRDQRGRWTTGDDAGGARSPSVKPDHGSGVDGTTVQAQPKPEPALSADATAHRKPVSTASVQSQARRGASLGRPVGPPYPHHSVTELPPVNYQPSMLAPAEQAIVSATAKAALTGTPETWAAFKAIEYALGMGLTSDPGPGRLVYEWRTGWGPQVRSLAPSSTLADQFADAPSTRQTVATAIHTLMTRRGGVLGDPRDRESLPYTVTRISGRFGPSEFLEDLGDANGAAHVIGDFRLDGIVDGVRIHWRATNDMGLHSFAAGRWTDPSKLPAGVPNIERPLPFGTTRQYIFWDTNLAGAYLRPKRTGRSGD